MYPPPNRSSAAEKAPYHDPQHPLRKVLVHDPNSQPLGVFLVCRHNAAWIQALPEERRPFDFEDPRTLKRWEERLEGRIYRIYGFNNGEKHPWEFLIVLEFDDMEAWKQLDQRLDAIGFATYFEWEVMAFGRRIG